MTWAAPTRGAAAARLYADAEADRVVRPERYRLDPVLAVERAMRKGVEPSDFAEGWRDGVAQYLGSAAQDGRLNALGTRMTLETAASRLAAGARLRTHLREHPGRVGSGSRTGTGSGGSGHGQAPPPIVIIGGWRTGTTLLFRLLATDPRLRAPLPAELAQPWRAAELRGEDRAAWIDRSSAAHDLLHLLNPELRAVHESGPTLPEECVLAMGTDLRNWGFSATVRLDGYTDWLAGEDLGPSYRRHRALLSALDDGDGRRWVLKAPAHTAELEHLIEAFPGVVIVQANRDIVETVASGASLFALFRSTYSDEVDPLDVGRFQLEQTERWMRRALAVRELPIARRASFVDLSYDDVVRAPGAALGAVYRAAGMDPPGDLDGFVERYHREHPRHEHGVHRYEPSDFGLRPDEVRERFDFLPSRG